MTALNCEGNQSEVLYLKEKYENFQKGIFQDKQEAIDQEKKQGDEIIQQVKVLSDEVRQEIDLASKQAKGL